MSDKNTKCENCMDKKTREEVRKMLKNYSRDKDHLIKILEDVQEKLGYLPQVAQMEVADHLNMSLAEVYGVITFYSRFSTEPKGKYNISICLGTACFVKGSEKILDKAKQMLNIEEGHTTPVGKFSIDATRWIGACGLAPVFVVNDEVYGKDTPEKMEEVIKEYRAKE